MPKQKTADDPKQVRPLEQFAVVMVPLRDLHPNKYNPNRQNPEEYALLKKSMLENGFTVPVLAHSGEDSDDPNKRGEIIDGFHRWTAANDLTSEGHPGFDPIPVVYANMTEIQQYAATLSHNRARGHEDMELLSGMLRDVEKLGGLGHLADSLQMSDEEMARLLSYGGTVLDTFPGDEPSAAWEPRQTAPGDLLSWDDPNARTTQFVASSLAGDNADYRPASNVPGLTASVVPARDGVATPSLMQRIIFVFPQDDALLVKRALGEDANAVLLNMCKEKIEREANTAN